MCLELLDAVRLLELFQARIFHAILGVSQQRCRYTRSDPPSLLLWHCTSPLRLLEKLLGLSRTTMLGRFPALLGGSPKIHPRYPESFLQQEEEHFWQKQRSEPEPSKEHFTSRFWTLFVSRLRLVSVLVNSKHHQPFSAEKWRILCYFRDNFPSWCLQRLQALYTDAFSSSGMTKTGSSGFSPRTPHGTVRSMISIPEHAVHPENMIFFEQNPIKQSSFTLKVSICFILIFFSRALVRLDHFLFLIWACSFSNGYHRGLIISDSSLPEVPVFTIYKHSWKYPCCKELRSRFIFHI